jgi:cation transport ATPase
MYIYTYVYIYVYIYIHAYIPACVHIHTQETHIHPPPPTKHAHTNKRAKKQLTNQQADKHKQATNKQTNKQANKQTNKQTNKQANKQTSKQTNKQANKQTNKQTSKQTKKETNKQTTSLRTRHTRQLRQAIGSGLVESAHDLSDGGLLVAVAESAIASGLGAHLELPVGEGRLDRRLFGEGGARVLVTVAAAQAEAWQRALVAAAVPASPLGVVVAEPQLRVSQGQSPVLEVSVDRLAGAFEQGIPRRLAQGGPPPQA